MQPNQAGGHPRFQTAHDVCIHSVPDHKTIGRMAPQLFSCPEHHGWIWFPEEIGGNAGHFLYCRHQGAARGHRPSQAGSGKIRIGGNELGAFLNQQGGLDDFGIIVFFGFDPGSSKPAAISLN